MAQPPLPGISPPCIPNGLRVSGGHPNWAWRDPNQYSKGVTDTVDDTVNDTVDDTVDDMGGSSSGTQEVM